MFSWDNKLHSYRLQLKYHLHTFSLGSFFSKRFLMTGTRPSFLLSRQQHCTTGPPSCSGSRAWNSDRVRSAAFSPLLLGNAIFQVQSDWKTKTITPNGVYEVVKSGIAACDQNPLLTSDSVITKFLMGKGVGLVMESQCSHLSLIVLKDKCCSQIYSSPDYSSGRPCASDLRMLNIHLCIISLVHYLCIIYTWCLLVCIPILTFEAEHSTTC